MTRIYEKYMILGIIGVLIILYGTTKWPPQPYYIVGCSALLATALHYNLFYYIALELILISGHAAVMLGDGPYIQIALPSLLSFQLLIFYLVYGKEKNLILLLGISGIALLSVGFAYNQQWIFLVGSTFIAIYSYYSAYRGRYPAYIWAILNTILACLCFARIFLL